MRRGRRPRIETSLSTLRRKDDLPAYARQIIRVFATRAYRRPITTAEESSLMAVFQKSFGCWTQLPGQRKRCVACRSDFAAVPVPDREEQHAGSGAA